MNNYVSKIGLGSVQWGLNYGISNFNGLTPADEVKKIIEYAKTCGITTIDTAREYGHAEKVLGENDITSFDLCTKIPTSRHLLTSAETEKHFKSSLNNSLADLKADKIQYLLMHDCNDLLEPRRDSIISLMRLYKDLRVVQKIGFSAYSSSQISSALRYFKPDIVQIPFSIFDQRLLQDGTLMKLKSLGVEIHARSIFLQGLLLMQTKDLDEYFAPFMPFINKWHDICAELSLRPLDLALHFVVSQPLIDKIIIGVSSHQQLKEIVTSVSIDKPNLYALSFSELAHCSEKLVNPALWALKK